MEKIKITKEQQVKVLSDKDTSAKSEEIVLSGVSRYKSKRQMEEVSRGSNHRTFKENEGGYRMKIYNHPIHYFDEDAKSYRRYNNQLSLQYGLPQSALKIKSVELVRCKLNKTVSAPAFFNGSECFSAKDISRVYYGSESYVVNADTPEEIMNFIGTIICAIAGN